MNTMQGRIRNANDITDFSVAGVSCVENPSLLTEISLPSLLSWIAVQKSSGTLKIITPNNLAYILYIRDASIVSIDLPNTDMINEAVAKMVNMGVITEADAQNATNKAKETNKSILQILFEQGSCTPRNIVEAIKNVKQETLDSLVTIKQAQYEWTEGKAMAKTLDPVPIDLNLFLINLVRSRTRTSYYQDLEPFLKPYMGRYPVKSQRLTPQIAGIALTEKERKIFSEIVDGSAQLKEVFTLSILTKNQTARLFLACNFLGLVDYRTTPLPKGGVEALENELKLTYERILSEDHFTRLALHWTNHPDMIRPAFEKMMERWGPNADCRKQSKLCAEIADRIVKLIKESFDVLNNPTTRRDYRKELLGDAKLAFGADFLFKQAHFAKFRGEIEKAKVLIESAIDILPRNEYLDFKRQLGG